METAKCIKLAEISATNSVGIIICHKVSCVGNAGALAPLCQLIKGVFYEKIANKIKIIYSGKPFRLALKTNSVTYDNVNIILDRIAVSILEFF